MNSILYKRICIRKTIDQNSFPFDFFARSANLMAAPAAAATTLTAIFPIDFNSKYVKTPMKKRYKLTEKKNKNDRGALR